MNFKILFSILLLCSMAHAEYRVYRLGIKYHPEKPDDKEVEEITTLDHLQYETYYKITPNQQTRLIKHWMCWGRTDYELPYCEEPIQSPNPSTTVRAPAQAVIK